MAHFFFAPTAGRLLWLLILPFLVKSVVVSEKWALAKSL